MKRPDQKSRFVKKIKEEILASSLEQWSLLKEKVQMSVYRDLTQFFTVKNDPVFHREISGLMTSLNIERKPEEWRLLIDSSMLILKSGVTAL